MCGCGDIVFTDHRCDTCQMTHGGETLEQVGWLISTTMDGVDEMFVQHLPPHFPPENAEPVYRKVES